MSEIKDILKRVSRICASIDLNYVIVGGVAAIIRGKPRTTMDIDLIIENDATKIEKFLNALKQLNFDVLDQQVELAFQADTNASIFDEKSILRLDLKIAKKSIDLITLENSQIIEYDQIQIRIASLEDILLGKIWFLGDISEITDSDLLNYNDCLDFFNVIQQNKENINFDLLHSKVKNLGYVDTLDRLLDFMNRKL